MKGFKPPIVKNSAKICPFVRMKDIGLKVIPIHSAVFMIWAALLDNKYIHTKLEDLIQLVSCQFIKCLYAKPHLFFCLSAVRRLLFRFNIL